mmetsp:Transcript_8161/g.20467  ORF Transcript_8161/g.20467 Transcript_8161/m.20467 type:complete len:628 (-) Transcript_8161:60-1943(-)
MQATDAPKKDSDASVATSQDDEDSVSELSIASKYGKALHAESKQGKATKLLRAAATGNLELVNSVLDASGAHPNFLTARGSTPLHEAAKGGHMVVVGELLRRSAEINSMNRNGCSPLHFATLCKDKSKGLEVVQFLLDAHAYVNSCNERRDYPLHFAAYCPPTLRDSEVVLALLRHRAAVNAQNRNAETSLMNATLHDNVEVVQCLAEFSADVNQKNYMDRNALDIAKERGCANVIQVLEKLKDPMTQLNDITQQMRTALSQMQTCDMLSRELQIQAALREAHEAAAVLAISMLDTDACLRMASHTIAQLRELESDGSTAATPTETGPCWARRSCNPYASSSNPALVAPAQRLMQSLVLLLAIARNNEGRSILHKIGVAEVLPPLERYTQEFNVGSKELRELKLMLMKPRVENDHSLENSACSTPTSLYESLAMSRGSLRLHSAQKLDFAEEHHFESVTPVSVATSSGALTPEGMLVLQRSRSLRPGRLGSVSSPCIISRGSLPSIAKVDEVGTGTGCDDTFDNESSGPQTGPPGESPWTTTGSDLSPSIPGQPAQSTQRSSQRKTSGKLSYLSVVPGECEDEATDNGTLTSESRTHIGLSPRSKPDGKVERKEPTRRSRPCTCMVS